MLKFKELLKPILEKYKLTALVLVVLVAFTIVICAASIGRSVNIYDGEIVTNLKTKKTFVNEILKEAGIDIGEFDAVQPPLEDRIRDDGEIFVRRAVPVKLFEGDVVKEFLTAALTVQDVLIQCGAELGEYDVVLPAAEEAVTSGMEIVIKRAAEVTLFADGEERKIHTVKTTAAEVLEEAGVVLGSLDRIEGGSDALVFNGAQIKIIRIASEILEVTEEINYETVKRPTSQLEKGQTRMVQEGKNGTKTVKYEVFYENGVEASRKVLSSKTIKKPQSAILEYGTVSVATTSRGESFRYSKMIKCTATAYDLSYASCGKRPGDRGYGITASGRPAEYGVVAVDTRVIPLGTRLYIEASDGKSWTYGYAVAGDTGSAIRGNRVDLFFNSRQEALNFGRKTANVYILE